MMIRLPGPDSTEWRDSAAGPQAQRAQLAALWALVLTRFRDYLQWAAELATDLRTHPGEPDDLDP